MYTDHWSTGNQTISVSISIDVAISISIYIYSYINIINVIPVLAFISFPFRSKETYSLVNRSTGQKPSTVTWMGKFFDRGEGSGFRTIPSYPIKPFGCPSIHKLSNKYCLLPVSLPAENFMLIKIFSKVLSPSYPTGMPLFGQVLKSICLCLNLLGRCHMVSLSWCLRFVQICDTDSVFLKVRHVFWPQFAMDLNCSFSVKRFLGFLLAKIHFEADGSCFCLFNRRWPSNMFME